MMSKTFTVTLATGTLHLEVEPGHIPLTRLLGFASRISSKRKFLLVSKVLGKHYPVTPRMMSWSYRALAQAVLKKGVIGASLWLGMAETATGLGYGVYEAAWHEGIHDGLFIQTTRYHLNDSPRLEFEEAHSHATDFFLYYPSERQLLKCFFNIQTLVLIDDEISTGKTFLRLIKAYQTINPALQKVFIVSLVNFAHPNDRRTLELEAGLAVEWICLRQGTLEFEDNQNQSLAAISMNVSSNGDCKKHLLGWPGRRGIIQPIILEESIVDNLSEHLKSTGDPRPILVLGTGECIAPAYLLGRRLATKGFNIKVQSTTRSPIHPGNDIGSVEQFEDNYEDAIPNFIYNLHPDAYREIIVCHETPINTALLERLHAWEAISARFEFEPLKVDHATIHFSRP